LNLTTLFSRQGKASALNTGVNAANGEIIVFSDASIMLDPKALKNIVEPFGDKNIGCVSGEDHIAGSIGGEGLYGRYELFLRNLESRANSVVGASGCFYAQRKDLCRPFAEGMAPDFLSVLNTVENGFFAVTCPSAVGYMNTVPAANQEYARKVRTFVRGITTLLYHKKLLNPFKYGFFSVELISHKLMRWLSGFFLIALFFSNSFLLYHPFYAFFFVVQAAFYIMAIIGWSNNKLLDKMKLLKIPFYFCLVNAASLAAWAKYLTGTRQEIWEPSKR
jgi:cellulose synthase/poly-beta-1,6-N-acetylglucosamine synthase-like glycosyltransferase